MPSSDRASGAELAAWLLGDSETEGKPQSGTCEPQEGAPSPAKVETPAEPPAAAGGPASTGNGNRPGKGPSADGRGRPKTVEPNTWEEPITDWFHWADVTRAAEGTPDDSLERALAAALWQQVERVMEVNHYPPEPMALWPAWDGPRPEPVPLEELARAYGLLPEANRPDGRGQPETSGEAADPEPVRTGGDPAAGAQLDLSAALAVAEGADAGGAQPKRRRSSSKPKAPPKPQVPNPFQDFPAPPPVPLERITELSQLQALVQRWQATPPDFVVLDVETTGLSPLVGAQVRLIQLLAEGEETTYVADAFALGNECFRGLEPLFAQQGTALIGHRIQFDLEMLRAAGLRCQAPVRCTQLAAKCLSRGRLPVALRISRTGQGLDLASCCGRLLKLNVAKDEQASAWGDCPEPGVPFSGLSEAQVAYAATDVWLTRALWLAQEPKLAEADLEETLRIECEALAPVIECRVAGGLTLDLETARELLASGEKDLQRLEQRLHEGLGLENVRSQPQLAKALTERGHDLPTTEKGNQSTAEKVLRPLYEIDPELDPLREHRAIAKNCSTYLKNWVRLAALRDDRRIFPQLNNWGTGTGRMSVGKGELPAASAMHQVPRESAMRGLFRAASGCLLIAGDWGSIEYRLAAAIYGETAYVRILEEGLDAHAYTAGKIYGRPIERDAEGHWPPERAIGKICNFALQYGGGVPTIREQMSQALRREVPEAEAKEVVEGWDRAFPVLARIRDGHRRAKPWEVLSINGRRMAGGFPTKGEPGVRHGGFQTARLAAPKALNYPIQAAGAELLKEAVALLLPRLWEIPGARLLHLVHDEIVIESPADRAQEAAEALRVAMEDPGLAEKYLRGVVPLVASVAIGETWADCK